MIVQSFLLFFAATIILFVQTIRFGREELAPTANQAQCTTHCLGALVTGVALWAVAKSATRMTRSI
jgi:hypothetical protein